jgi:hypothetical protein
MAQVWAWCRHRNAEVITSRGGRILGADATGGVAATPCRNVGDASTQIVRRIRLQRERPIERIAFSPLF